MANGSRANRLRSWQITACLLGVLALLACTIQWIHFPRALLPGEQGTLGYLSDTSSFQGRPAHRIIALVSESPLLKADVSVGDFIVDPPRGWLWAGERIPLLIGHAGEIREIEIHASAVEGWVSAAELAVASCLELLAFLLGVLVAVRRRDDPSALSLASAFFLATIALSPGVVDMRFIAALNQLVAVISPMLFLIVLAYFLLALGAPAGAGRTRVVRSIGALAFVVIAWSVGMAPYFFGKAWSFHGALATWVRAAIVLAGVALCVAASVHTWRTVQAEQKERLRWLFVGFGVALVALLLVAAGMLGLFPATVAMDFGIEVTVDVLVGVGLVILTYAILRRRVIDVGFAINRALVFAAISGVMLVAFGFIELMVDHFLEFEGRKNSVLLDGSLAVGVYLVVHRAQHWIAHTTEHVFFRSWHSKETALNAFLATSMHFSVPQPLADEFVRAVDAYADCEGSGLYRRDDDGRFILQSSTLSTLPQELPTDAPVAIDLKTFNAPRRLEGRLRLVAGEWAFPVIRRAGLIGFLVIGHKPDRDVYRPDEIANLARVTMQVVFDLYALRLEHLTVGSGSTPLEASVAS